MAGLPTYFKAEPGRQVRARDINRLASDVAAGTAVNGFSAGIVGRPTPFGTFLNPAYPPALLAIIGDASSDSSSSDSSSTSISVDQQSAYGWQEAQWVVDGLDYKVEIVPDGLRGTISERPAMEANNDPSVPAGTVVWLYPGWGAPDFYYFFRPESDSSSDQVAFTIDCEAGTIIIGSGGTTTNPPTGKPTDGTSSSGGIAPIDNNTIFGSGGPGVTEGVTPGTP